MTLLYKIVPAELWRTAEDVGCFLGALADLRDGYMHFSTAAQVRKTALRHFSRVSGLLLVAIDSRRLDRPVWEPSRDGELFPHLYGKLPTTEVAWIAALPLGRDGMHVFPDTPG